MILTCISYFMQFLYLLSVYLTSLLLSKYDVVVILNSILDQKEKENWRVLRLSSHLYRYCLLSVMLYGVCLHFTSSCLRNVHMDMGVVSLFLTNSLVNPIIFAVRMPGFREGLLQIGYRVPDLSRIAPANLPLRNLRRA